MTSRPPAPTSRNDWLGKAFRKIFDKGGANALANPKLLRLAVAFNRVDLVLHLLGRGADVHAPDRRGQTVLHLAASRRMVRTLLEAGARLHQADQLGRSPLQSAVRRGKEDAADALLRAGADIHAQDRRGMSALHVAASKGRRRAMEQLLARGAWVNVPDRHGRSPLFFAVAAGQLNAALFLIERGADLLMLDDRGTPWLHLARMDQVVLLQQTMDRVLAEESQREWNPMEESTLAGRMAADRYAQSEWSMLEPAGSLARVL